VAFDLLAALAREREAGDEDKTYRASGAARSLRSYVREPTALGPRETCRGSRSKRSRALER
jgi:hypothetical protein